MRRYGGEGKIIDDYQNTFLEGAYNIVHQGFLFHWHKVLLQQQAYHRNI